MSTASPTRRSRPTRTSDVADRSLIAIVTEAFGSPESVAALKREVASGDGDATEVRLVAPAVEINPLHHTLGDIDEPRVEAKERLAEAVATARAAGLEVSGEVGDPDPVQAAQDALLKKPADQILIFAHADDSQAWYEGDLWKHAEDSLEPPLKLVVVDGGPEGNERVVGTETSGPGLADTDAGIEVDSAYGPKLTRGDLGGITLGIVGTIIAIVLAAAATGGGTATGWRAVAIGLAIAIALVNMANVVGVLLMESVRYRGGFAKTFRNLALVGTPLVVLINLAIALFA
jgi:nucleotide-binding universal stress UspA family protein